MPTLYVKSLKGIRKDVTIISKRKYGKGYIVNVRKKPRRKPRSGLGQFRFFR